MGSLIKKYRSGTISGTIWLNEKAIEDKVVGFKTVSLQRWWKDKNGVNRDETLNIRKQDVAKLLVILQKIQEDLLLTEDENE